MIVPRIPPTINKSLTMNNTIITSSQTDKPELLASFNKPMASTKSVKVVRKSFLVIIPSFFILFIHRI